LSLGTPLFYFLVPPEETVLGKTPKTTEFLQLLQANMTVYLDVEARDPQGLSVLDYVVRFSTGEEVKALLRWATLLLVSSRMRGHLTHQWQRLSGGS